MGPPIQIFLTSIASAPALRQRQEHLLRTLQVKKIPFTSYDLASDEEAKKLWRRKAPANNSSLPGILVGGEFAGTYTQFEEAVEFGELDQFLKVNEPWGDEDEALTPAPSPQKPIGVPGAATPSQMTGQRPSFAPSPSGSSKKSANRTKSIDIGTELGFGLEGVKLNVEDMLELVESLGLGGEDANDLVKGLGLASSKSKPKAASDNVPAPAAPEPTPPPKTDATASTPSGAAGSVGGTTTTPSDLVTSGSKDQAGGEPPEPDDVLAADSTTPSAAQASDSAAKDLPPGKSIAKVSQPDIPESVAAVSPPNAGTQLPSVTNEQKDSLPQDNTVPNALPDNNVDLQECSRG